MLLAAHPLELQPAGPLLRQSALNAGPGGLRVEAVTVGVGLSFAGGGTARALCRFAPRAALLLGSVGAYPGAGPVETPLHLSVPDAFHLCDAAGALGLSALPPAMTASFTADEALAEGLRGATGAHGGSLATTLGITTDDGLAARLRRDFDFSVENLEAHAVAAACHRAGVAFAALFATTNRVGQDGRSQWQQHSAAAADTTAAALGRFLAAGAPGLP